ncbi:MAG: preprotein translocase subunit SecY [Candidatus Lokiarchaeota archaeon]|nr:preprotein translocase subunit SecY [Candidatus Lokiarchaeota archaeon]
MAGKFLKFFSPMVRVMPEIKQPQREVRFKEKFIWTFVILIVFLIMSHVPLYGVELQQSTDYFFWLRVILASSRGTLTELGIGPIVTAGLIMQLLQGSKMVKIDLNDPYDRSLFSGTQKALAMILTSFNALMYILGGQFGDVGFSDGMFIFLQLFFAGMLIILMDELLQKGWGLGSGVSLFIAANIAGQIFWNCFSFIPTSTVDADGLPRGIVIAFFTVLFDNDPTTTLGTLWTRGTGQLPSLLGSVMTLTIFVIVIWFESTRVEIPLQYKGYKGFKGKYPMKLLYVSNIPVILVNAFYATFLFFGQWLCGPTGLLRGAGVPDFWVDLIGRFDTTPTQADSGGNYLSPVYGLLYYLTPPRGLDELASNPVRIIFYLPIFIFLCIKLGKMWVSVSGLSPRDVAGQIIDSGMQIPGFRSSEKIIERILKRYIPTLIVLNGIIIALLSFFADGLGALTSGTGLLIAIGITHQYAETISKELAASQYPGMRALLGMD